MLPSSYSRLSGLPFGIDAARSDVFRAERIEVLTERIKCGLRDIAGALQDSAAKQVAFENPHGGLLTAYHSLLDYADREGVGAGPTLKGFAGDFERLAGRLRIDNPVLLSAWKDLDSLKPLGTTSGIPNPMEARHIGALLCAQADRYDELLATRKIQLLRFHTVWEARCRFAAFFLAVGAALFLLVAVQQEYLETKKP